MSRARWCLCFVPLPLYKIEVRGLSLMSRESMPTQTVIVKRYSSGSRSHRCYLIAKSAVSVPVEPASYTHARSAHNATHAHCLSHCAQFTEHGMIVASCPFLSRGVIFRYHYAVSAFGDD